MLISTIAITASQINLFLAPNIKVSNTKLIEIIKANNCIFAFCTIDVMHVYPANKIIAMIQFLFCILKVASDINNTMRISSPIYSKLLMNEKNIPILIHPFSVFLNYTNSTEKGILLNTLLTMTKTLNPVFDNIKHIHKSLSSFQKFKRTITFLISLPRFFASMP